MSCLHFVEILLVTFSGQIVYEELEEHRRRGYEIPSTLLQVCILSTYLVAGVGRSVGLALTSLKSVGQVVAGQRKEKGRERRQARVHSRFRQMNPLTCTPWSIPPLFVRYYDIERFAAFSHSLLSQGSSGRTSNLLLRISPASSWTSWEAIQ